MLAEAEATDLAEDEEFGEDKRGDELPPELATKEGRLAKLRAAKESIEAEAKEKAAQKAEEKAKERGASEERPTPPAPKRPEGPHRLAGPSATSPTPSHG
jgi:septal ring factor EnvC (AmiA/AmiB activator)